MRESHTALLRVKWSFIVQVVTLFCCSGHVTNLAADLHSEQSLLHVPSMQGSLQE